MKTHYKAVFISDLHLGFSGANAKSCLSFLKSVTCDELYLVGDILGLWEMKGGIRHWNQYCTSVLVRIVKMAKNGTQVYIIPGNHDEDLRKFTPSDLSDNIHLVDHCLYEKDGVRYLVIHGDQVDIVIGSMKWIGKIGSVLYGVLIDLNSFVHKIRVYLGYRSYWSLSKYVKSKAKRAASFISDFELAMKTLAATYDCTGVICGHIHTCKIDGTYINCGDWVESLTAIVDDGEGFKIIEWSENEN